MISQPLRQTSMAGAKVQTYQGAMYRHYPARREQALARKSKTYGIVEDGFMGMRDVSDFLGGCSEESAQQYADLAYQVGDAAYIDINGWNIYFKDVKVIPTSDVSIASLLAQQLGPKLDGGTYTTESVEDILRTLPLRLGGEKQLVSLYNAMPDYSVQELKRVLTSFSDGGDDNDSRHRRDDRRRR